VVFELIASNYCYPTYVGEASGCYVVNDFVTFQVAAICGLIGMTLGWRGVMTKYSGFYDLPTAWNQVFWGILLGGAYASLADNTLFLPFYESYITGTRSAELNFVRQILIPLIATIGVHFLLIRKRVRKGGSQATSGWALGLAVGCMLSIVLITRKIQHDVSTVFDGATILLIGFYAPRMEALICSYHGVLMLQGKRLGAVFRTVFWRILALNMLYFAWDNPFAWVFIIPPILLFKDTAEKWVWDSVPKEGRRRWRRMQADKKREKQASARLIQLPNTHLEEQE
tara:strand:- start:1008 stop:1859 length:852 start_codon:yes stop_codon:yes gene_type:complete